MIRVGCTWKLCDFGLSRYIGNNTLALSTVGTHVALLLRSIMICSQPPENVSSGICSKAVDVYSFGCLASYVMTGKIPFSEYSMDEQIVFASR